jgi:hypothetical protein
MLKSLRKCHRSAGIWGAQASLALVSAALLAGCSANVSRFDLGNPESASASSNSSAMGGRSASSEFGSAGYDRPAYRGNDVARSDLPPPDGRFSTSAIPPEQNSYQQDA